MKRLSSSFALALLGLMLFAAAQASAQKKAVLWAAEDIKWEALKGAAPGVMSTTLWGDAVKGPYAGLTKFPAGFKAPLHFHTNDMKMVVIKGGYTYKGKKYGPGSYLFIPGGDKHESGGVEDSETIFFVEQSGPFDFQPVESPKEKK